jgi:hypothetical protein
VSGLPIFSLGRSRRSGYFTGQLIARERAPVTGDPGFDSRTLRLGNV